MGGEAPAELTTQWFGRSLTLPSNEFVGQGPTKHVYRGGVRLPLIFNPFLFYQRRLQGWGMSNIVTFRRSCLRH